MSTNNATLFQIRLTLLLLILLLCALCCGLCLAFSGAVSNWCEDSGCCTEYEGCWCGKHLMYMTFICCCLSVTRVRDTYVRWSGLHCTQLVSLLQTFWKFICFTGCRSMLTSDDSANGGGHELLCIVNMMMERSVEEADRTEIIWKHSCRIRGVPGIFLDVVGAKVAVDWTDVCLFDQWGLSLCAGSNVNQCKSGGVCRVGLDSWHAGAVRGPCSSHRPEWYRSCPLPRRSWFPRWLGLVGTLEEGYWVQCMWFTYLNFIYLWSCFIQIDTGKALYFHCHCIEPLTWCASVEANIKPRIFLSNKQCAAGFCQ